MSVMITAWEFKQRWEKVPDDRLISFPESSFSDVHVPPDTRPAAFGRYRIIGGNGSGDPVCLDEATPGEIVYLNHDNKFRRVLMASSVFSLAECLLELRDLVEQAGSDTERVPAQDYDALLARFRAIDTASSGKGCFWDQELGSLKPVQEKPWWKFLRKPLW